MNSKILTKRQTAVLASVTLASIILVGFASIWSHELPPGARNAPPVVWPKESRLPGESGKIRVVLFAHPRCPCTRASLSELERIMAHNSESAAVCVVFYRPSSQDGSWTKSDTCRLASQMNGVQVYFDQDGAETQRFRAETSGMTVVYGGDGALLFAGGITPSRGHAGDNTGADALLLAVSGQTPAVPDACVFGCRIFSGPPTERSNQPLN